MTRAIVALLLVAGVARADVPVAPPPREVRPAGSRDPVPPADPAEDPVAVVARIIKNGEAAGDRLAAADTGADTRTTQKTILKDIDALINRQDDDPPPKGGEGGEPPPDGKPDQKPNDMGGMDQGGQQPKGKGGRKPRGKGDTNPGQPMTGDDPGRPAGDKPGSKNEPAAGAKPGDPKDGMAGAVVEAKPDGKSSRPTLPLDDEVNKEVWGHLPDKLRQQVTQYYKEQFMPRYTDLLKQYYSSLAAPTGRPELRK